MHDHDPIDRISPTLEPDQQTVMRQDWHHLAFLHWEVPAMELQRLVPAELTIDTFEGKAYVGLVPFTVTNARPILMPAIPGVSNFHEINVRTYVHYRGANPGVWFFSLDASSGIAVAAARAAYHLNYFQSKIDFARRDDGSIAFISHREDERGPTPANAHLRYGPSEGLTAPAKPGTLEHFLVERYILYASDSQHQLYTARIHHQPYPLQKAEIFELDETLIWAAGIKRGEGVPIRHYASEVNVNVYAPQRVTG